MKNLRDLLKDADPLGDEAPLSDADLQRMRRVVVTNDARAASPSAAWSPVRWAALAVAIAVVAGLGVQRWPALTRQPAETSVEPEQPSPSRRQVQFITAGGTRIVWVFNSEFETPTGSNR
jgi:hypothetical protein